MASPESWKRGLRSAVVRVPSQNSSNDASEWVGPRHGLGDPHFRALDGFDYTFNGLDDFLFPSCNSSSFEITARLVSWPGYAQVSVIAALAFNANANVLFLLANSGAIDFYLDAELYSAAWTCLTTVHPSRVSTARLATSGSCSRMS